MYTENTAKIQINVKKNTTKTFSFNSLPPVWINYFKQLNSSGDPKKKNVIRQSFSESFSIFVAASCFTLCQISAILIRLSQAFIYLKWTLKRLMTLSGFKTRIHEFPFVFDLDKFLYWNNGCFLLHFYKIVRPGDCRMDHFKIQRTSMD